jgi:hypothetical protein
MRASAYPAEDPNTLKHPNDLLDCYLWFFGKASSNSKGSYFDYSELSKIVS